MIPKVVFTHLATDLDPNRNVYRNLMGGQRIIDIAVISSDEDSLCRLWNEW